MVSITVILAAVIAAFIFGMAGNISYKTATVNVTYTNVTVTDIQSRFDSNNNFEATVIFTDGNWTKVRMPYAEATGNKDLEPVPVKFYHTYKKIVLQKNGDGYWRIVEAKEALR